MLCNGISEEIYANQVAIVNWCEPHMSIGFLKDTVHYVLKIDSNNPVFSFVNLANKKFPNFLKRQEVDFKIFEDFIDIHSRKEINNPYALIGQTYIILGELLKLSTENDKNNWQSVIYTKNILEYIHEHIEQDISLEEISETLNISVSHMCRVFKKHTCKTIVEYINTMKINLAIPYLRDGYSVAYVSSKVGFSDYNYFSRLFKKVMGVSPSNYKN